MLVRCVRSLFLNYVSGLFGIVRAYCRSSFVNQQRERGDKQVYKKHREMLAFPVFFNGINLNQDVYL